MTPPRPNPPVIVLLSDMGLTDWYVGNMKGVALCRCPNAQLIDLCHDVHKQNVREAGFMLRVSYRYFPRGSIFLCVVDPYVGTSRHCLAARSGDYYFVAPDNGLLSLVANDSKTFEVRAIQNPSFQLEKRSETFHGRDIFAPAAGCIAAGAPFEEIGPVIESTATLARPDGLTISEHHVEGVIIYIDTYGNLVTNVTPEDLPPDVPAERFRLHIKGRLIEGISPHFAAVPMNHPLMYWGSAGFLEIAINQGAAAHKWSLTTDEWFDMEWT